MQVHYIECERLLVDGCERTYVPVCSYIVSGWVGQLQGGRLSHAVTLAALKSVNLPIQVLLAFATHLSNVLTRSKSNVFDSSSTRVIFPTTSLELERVLQPVATTNRL